MIEKINQRTLKVLVPHFSWPASYNLSWFREFLASHLADRLVESSPNGPELSLLESCAISREGISCRLQLKKNIYFHDGSEVSSQDVIDSLLRSLQSPLDVSQLKLALRTPDNPSNSFRRHSRYRFEILLNQPIGDLLNRLSHSDFRITKAGNQLIGSGPWKIEKAEDKRLILAVHSDGCRAAHQFYQKAIIEAVSEGEEVDHNEYQNPFIILYPGSGRKSFPNSLTNNFTSYRLDSELQFAIILQPQLPRLKSLASILSSCCREFLARKSHWSRSPLDRILHQNHPYHIPIKKTFSQAAVSSFSPRAIRIAYLAGTVAATLLEHFKIFLSGKNVDCEFVATSYTQARDSFRQGEFDGFLACWPSSPWDEIWKIWSDCLLPIDELIHHKNFAFSTQLQSKTMLSQLQLTSRFQQYVKELCQKDWFIPLMRAPFMLDSNQLVEFGLIAQDYLDLGQVKMGVHVAREQEFRQAALAAIGSAVQIFAHDVKKPFSLLHSLFSLIEACDDPWRIQAIVQRYFPDLKRSIHDVNGMLHDIIAITDRSDIIKEPFSLNVLIHECLRDLLLINDDGSIQVKLELKHRNLVDGDRYKIARVISNIIVNAKQAMSGKGLITISSHQSSEDPAYLELIISNTGSYIPNELRSVIFEAFYTHSKRQGTGLGLAIAKKFVLAHGGKISCKSSRKDGTAFHMTLPVTDAVEQAPAAISNDLPEAYIPHSAPLAYTNTKCSVLMIDDEVIYLDLMEELIKEVSDLDISFLKASHFNSARSYLETMPTTPDLILVDVDLNDENFDGFTTVRELRKKGLKSRICLHSNRGMFEFQSKALECGADLFIPKPMNRKQLKQLLNAVLAERQVKVDEIEVPARTDAAEIIIIDDDILVLEHWQSIAGNFTVKTFDEPEVALTYLKNKVQSKGTVQAVILDYYFNDSPINGVGLAQKIKAIASWPIILVSNVDQSSLGSEERKFFTDFLPKEPELVLEKLKAMKLDPSA